MIQLSWIKECNKYLYLYKTSKRAVIRNYSEESGCLRTSLQSYHQQCPNNKSTWNVLFFGTDTFAVESLRRLQNSLSTNLLSKLEVVSSVNSAKENEVIRFAKEYNIKVHSWPMKIPLSEFDIGIVVSFGHLIPKWIIQSFPLGMINVHASRLPRWRGAAPIIYSLIHGDTTTGISIIKIEPHKFDTGDILADNTIPIHPDETQLELYDKMARHGAELLVKTVEKLPTIIDNGKSQPDDNVTYAPKITPALSVIHWDKMTAVNVYNLHRALFGIYPLTTYFHGQKIKLHGIQQCNETNFNSSNIVPGLAVYDKKTNFIVVQCQDGRWVSVKEISMIQRRKMTATDFYNGFMTNDRKRKIIFTSEKNTF